MNASDTNNHIGFRLPREPMLVLNKLASSSGVSKNQAAKELVLSELAQFGTLEQFMDRVGELQDRVTQLSIDNTRAAATQADMIAALKVLASSVDTLRASIATIVVRVLVDLRVQDVETATKFVAEAFDLQEWN